MRRRRRVRGHQPTRHAGPCQQWQVKTSGSMTVCTTSSELPASADCSLGCMPEPCTPSASMCLKSCVRLGNSCSGASQAWRRHERGVRSGWHAATLQRGMRYRYSTLRHGTTGRLGGTRLQRGRSVRCRPSARGPAPRASAHPHAHRASAARISRALAQNLPERARARPRVDARPAAEEEGAAACAEGGAAGG
jgi:hypothetical protein